MQVVDVSVGDIGSANSTHWCPVTTLDDMKSAHKQVDTWYCAATKHLCRWGLRM